MSREKVSRLLDLLNRPQDDLESQLKNPEFKTPVQLFQEERETTIKGLEALMHAITEYAECINISF